VLITVLALGLGGCAGLSGILPAAPTLADAPPPLTASAETWTEGAGPDSAVEVAHPEPPDARQEIIPAAGGDAVLLTRETTPVQSPPPDVEMEEYDPLEPFNEKMFEFNRALDRYVLKPAAKGYNFLMPELVQQMVGNGFDNIRFVPRLVNSFLQRKWAGAGRELGRFLINSTFGIGGLFDMAKTEFGIEKSREDGGQTLGVWGAGPGPYLVLPFLPPLTVRDGIGLAFDMALDPLGYVLPFFWDRAGMKVGDTINDRSLNLELYQGFEETTVEFYSALRNAYLQRRLKLIAE
jgi:phospholipid-binding lipoprotein MlaA